mgnify:CR=1 FL=1
MATRRSVSPGSPGGEAIAEGRLLAVPAAALCSDCQRQLETATHAR